MTEQPYDFARERDESLEEQDRRGQGTRYHRGHCYDEADFPDPADVADLADD